MSLRLMIHRDKQILRKINLLLKLGSPQGEMTVGLLSKELECTRPTLRETIDYLNYRFQNQFFISISTKSVVELHCDSFIPVDVFINEIVKESMSYRIIVGLFKGEYKNLVDAQQTLGVSRTFILQKIEMLNQALAVFDVAITTRHFDFHGDETNIRLFLFNFFLEFGDLEIVSKHSIKEVRKFMKFADEIDPSMRFSQARLAIWIPIVLARWKKRRFVSEKEINVCDLIDETEYKRFPDLFKKTWGKHIPDEEIRWFYITSLYCISYSDPTDLIRTNYTVIANEKNQQAILSLFKALFETENQLMIDTGGGSERGGVYAFLINMLYLKRISKHFDYVPDQIVQTMTENYEALFNKRYNLLSNVVDCEILSLIVTKNVAVSLTAFQVSIDKQKHDLKTPHILFSFIVEAGFEHYIVKDSKILVKDSVNVSYYMDDRIVDSGIIAYHQPDIIVCNHYLLHEVPETTAVIRLTNFPTVKEWQQAERKISETLLERQN